LEVLRPQGDSYRGVDMFCRWNINFFFRFSGWNVQKRRKIFDSGEKKTNIGKKLLDAKKTSNDPSGGFSGPKKAFRLRYDASMFT
jgi:hypothetical protein